LYHANTVHLFQVLYSNLSIVNR